MIRKQTIPKQGALRGGVVLLGEDEFGKRHWLSLMYGPVSAGYVASKDFKHGYEDEMLVRMYNPDNDEDWLNLSDDMSERVWDMYSYIPDDHYDSVIADIYNFEELFRTTFEKEDAPLFSASLFRFYDLIREYERLDMQVMHLGSVSILSPAQRIIMDTSCDRAEKVFYQLLPEVLSDIVSVIHPDPQCWEHHFQLTCKWLR